MLYNVAGVCLVLPASPPTVMWQGGCIDGPALSLHATPASSNLTVVQWEFLTVESPHWLQWDAPHLPPPSHYLFLLTDPQTPLPASPTDPSDLPCQMASGSDQPFFHNALGRLTDQQIVNGKV